VADNDAALSEQVLNVAKAEVKPKVQPDGVSDDLGREALATVRRRVVLGCGQHQGDPLSLIIAQLDNSSCRVDWAGWAPQESVRARNLRRVRNLLSQTQRRDIACRR